MVWTDDSKEPPAGLERLSYAIKNKWDAIFNNNKNNKNNKNNENQIINVKCETERDNFATCMYNNKSKLKCCKQEYKILKQCLGPDRDT
tara:strand:- start:556 stop:822 length:267 start_codon:yes stop_codon:yes gene_type:complete